MIGKSISHYKIIAKLGEGGMGVVYKAEDTRLQRTVALKFLPPHLGQSEEEKKRFVQEAKAASALDHNNICTVHEIDETEDGQMFIAMACYEGESLKAKIATGPLPIDEALDLAIQTVQGLAKAHSKEIIHRDIKPANILVTEDKTVKIVDFGLAKLAGRTMLTKEGTTLGTVAYMSPEQAQGAKVDHRTDIWALGVVLYEMLTGDQPFKGDYEQAVMYSIMNEDTEPITGLRTGVPMELERIVNKALAKSQEERYQQVDEMLVDLSSLKKDLESSKSKAKLPRTKVPHRNRTYLYIGAGILFILLIVVGLSLFTGRGEAINSIAVLPLENLSGDTEQEYFSDGLTDALINELAQIKALRVISRTSIMQYKRVHRNMQEIANELNVDALVEGTVLRVEGRVRVTAQLIQAVPEQHLWSQSYDSDYRDILTLQTEVARSIATEIKIALTSEEEQELSGSLEVDPEMYEAYLKGRFHFFKMTGEGISKAMEYAQEAIAKDSSYAPAHALLAACYSNLPYYVRAEPKEAYPKAKAAAMKALEIDETFAEAHIRLAWVLAVYDWDWQGAEREYGRGLELNPGSAVGHRRYGFFLSWIGRFDQAIEEARKAEALDPVSLPVSQNLAAVLIMARRYDEAIEYAQKTIDMDPNFMFAYFRLGMAYEAKGIYEKALESYRKANALAGGRNEMVRLSLGRIHALLGQRTEALKILKEWQDLNTPEYVSPSHTAAIYTWLGQKQKAIDLLEKAYDVRDFDMNLLKVWPIWDPLRSEPRFQNLLKRMGFPETKLKLD